jgi:hypothetical protein
LNRPRFSNTRNKIAKAKWTVFTGLFGCGWLT